MNKFGLCPECKQPNTEENWCKECYSKKFQQNFGNWTSGNDHIDKFIQDAQLNASHWGQLLEWIPYDRLRNIRFLAQGGFSTIYECIWLDGLIVCWDYEKQQWKRFLEKIPKSEYECANNPEIKNPLKSSKKDGNIVALKSLNDSSNIHEDFLNEWKLHLQCQYEAFSAGKGIIVPLFGITQDPDTLNYMIVMYITDGSLRNNLLTYKYNSNDKFYNLLGISAQLEAIHKLNLVHKDFHNGNLLYVNYDMITISDFGLCRPVNQSNTENDIYGVLPYMAPEVLRGKPYTKAADIYSFGIIMWEMTSGVPAFHNIPHDFHLSLDICRGIRPGIIEGTIPEYVELMKRCWDNDPEKRPTANELKWNFYEWQKKYPMEEDEKKRIPVPEDEPRTIYHPKSYYTSRRFDYSTKLNEFLAKNELSNISNYNEAVTSENLDDCLIKDLNLDE